VKFVLAGIGTKGDLLPLAALGGALRRRGHACDLLTNENYAALARQHDLGFHVVTVPQTTNLVSGRDNLEQHVFPSYEPTFAYFRKQVARGEPLAVINLDAMSASNLMCDRLGLLSCRVFLQPSTIPSLLRPPYPYNERIAGRLSAAYRKHRLPRIYRDRNESPYLVRRINEYRARLELAPVAGLDALDGAVALRLGLFPEWYAPPAGDWPEHFEHVGFPLPPATGELPAALSAFIEREGKPLVFTPGTGVNDVQAFFDDARRCCAELDYPGVFLSPSHRPDGSMGSRLFHAAFVELEPLLARSALLVHHGGIGTTARALQAGIPQVIRAVAYDQPDNGDRVQRLGVGAFFAPGKYRYEDLTLTIQRLLASAEVRRELDAVRARLAATDAIEAAVDRLERVF
jgi:rhamnosyltransferase subunit B